MIAIQESNVINHKGTADDDKKSRPVYSVRKRGTLCSFGKKINPLPVVDIGAMQHENPVAKSNVAQQVGKAAMDSGFLYIENHSVSEQLIDEVYQYARRFFCPR